MHSTSEMEPWSFSVRDYLQLAKARLASMVLLSALVGYWIASRELVLSELLWFAAGTFLVVAGANAFNQILERDSDARMERTARRPLPSGRVPLPEALFVASVASVAGVGILFVTSGALCGALALVALGTYVLIYTPMKSRSAFSTVPGAVAGAIPPLMGVSAAQGFLGPLAWCMFGILFFWQFPHTWAIASTYRDDYARVGYRAMPQRGTRLRTILATLALIAASLMPAVLGLTGTLYLYGALVLGGFFVVAAVRFDDGTFKPRAVQLLAASLFYLPLVLALLALDGKVA